MGSHRSQRERPTTDRTAATLARVSERGAIPPFIVMDVLRAANEREAAGDSVLHLEVGQPGSAAPERVREAARTAAHSERLGYTDALGLPALRQRIAAHYGDAYGVDVDWRRVVVATGSSGAFVLAFLAAFDAGDRIAVTRPGYPAYRNILTALGTTVIDLEVGPDTHFQPTHRTLDDLNQHPDGLIIASPANPTGSMLDGDALQALSHACTDRGTRLISDEIYHGITYGPPAETALAFTDDAIVVNSFSKYYAMTGWRLGWMVLPETLLRSIECLAQNLFISPPTLSQHAAIAAFDCCDELDAHVARYARNRDILLAGLQSAGFGTPAPADGAFYVYSDASPLTDDSVSFCRRMLAETGVAATPGVDFDPVRGSRFVRFSFAGETTDIVEAVRRLTGWTR